MFEMKCSFYLDLNGFCFRYLFPFPSMFIKRQYLAGVRCKCQYYILSYIIASCPLTGNVCSECSVSWYIDMKACERSKESAQLDYAGDTISNAVVTKITVFIML